MQRICSKHVLGENRVSGEGSEKYVLAEFLFEARPWWTSGLWGGIRESFSCREVFRSMSLVKIGSLGRGRRTMLLQRFVRSMSLVKIRSPGRGQRNIFLHCTFSNHVFRQHRPLGALEKNPAFATENTRCTQKCRLSGSCWCPLHCCSRGAMRSALQVTSGLSAAVG